MNRRVPPPSSSPASPSEGPSFESAIKRLTEIVQML